MAKKAQLLEEIEQYESELDELKMKLKKEPEHITWSELAEEDKFCRLPQGRKRLTDTIKYGCISGRKLNGKDFKRTDS